MRAVVADKVGGPEVLQVRDVPVPEVGPGEVLVRVLAVGVNYIDVYHRTGLYPKDVSQGLGLEGAGEVVQTGHEVTAFSTGQLVGWIGGKASYAEYCLLAESELIPLPAGTDPELAAGVLLQGLTAHALATSVYPIGKDDPVLVHAAAGGVGQMLTQMACMRGGVVHATASSNSKAQAATDAGATFVYDYDDFVDGVRKNTERGVAAAYDGIGAATASRSLDALRPRGVLVVYGAAGGLPEPLDLQRLNAQGSLYVTRPTVMEYTSRPGERDSRTADLFDWIARGRLRVNVARRYSLDEAAQAHRDLESRSTIGKLLLIPHDSTR
ncbi:quinone oxidoreductase family protein [Actinomadura sp. 9N215]|uniref:quinone oxidoreductase family protein n=1 Tax=Actinomadura sp. 9N215 TaxID=3375150 RepID=UPI0037AB2544